MASKLPTTKPSIFLPISLTESSNSNASDKMAIMGPNITALGETAFISAQISPERQIKPFSGH